MDLRLDLLRGVRSDHPRSHEERPGVARPSHAGWVDVRKGRLAGIIMVFASLGFIALLVVPTLDHRFGWGSSFLVAESRGAVVGFAQFVRRSAESAELTRIYVLPAQQRSEEHTSELQSRENLVCRLLLE